MIFSDDLEYKTFNQINQETKMRRSLRSMTNGIYYYLKNKVL